MKAYVCRFQVLVSYQPKNLNWYDGLFYFPFTWCSKRNLIVLGTVTVRKSYPITT